MSNKMDFGKPYEMHVDYNRGIRFFVQGGVKYSHDGKEIRDSEPLTHTIPCSKCDAMFADKSSLLDHLKNIHRAGREIIDREMLLADKILSGEMSVQKKVEPPTAKKPEETCGTWPCSKCGFTAKTKFGLMAHARKHKGG